MEINDVIAEYAKAKEEMDKIKKSVDSYNKLIKKMLKDAGLDEYSSEEYTVSKTEINADKIDEDKLIKVIHKDCPEDISKQLIHTEEVLDLDKLEDLLYNRVIKADMVNDCIIHKTPTIRLNIRKVKEEEKDG